MRFDFPQRRVTLNLAPADLPRAARRSDLAIALDILAASGKVGPQSLLQYEYLGELRPVPRFGLILCDYCEFKWTSATKNSNAYF